MAVNRGQIPAENTSVVKDENLLLFLLNANAYMHQSELYYCHKAALI